MNELDGQVVIFWSSGSCRSYWLSWAKPAKRLFLIENPEDYHQIDLLRPIGRFFHRQPNLLMISRKLNENIKNHAQTK